MGVYPMSVLFLADSPVTCFLILLANRGYQGIQMPFILISGLVATLTVGPCRGLQLQPALSSYMVLMSMKRY